MNATIKKAIKVCPHFVLTWQKPNKALQITEPEQWVTPKTFGSKIRNLLQIVQQLVQIANRKAYYHMDKRLENSIYRELLKQGDRILFFRTQSMEAKRTKLIWIGPVTVIATNDMVIKVRDSDGDKSSVHRISKARL